MSGAKSRQIATLEGQAWLQDPALHKVLEVLGGESGDATRVVGGAVRNALFARPVRDIDLATQLSPREVLAKAGKAGLKAVPTGIDHGTVTVIANGRPFEVTTLRLDIETYGRHARVAFTHDWAEDAARRDFTINALYADLNGKIHDPLGGLPDVAARHVRFIGDADARISEDYLRVLRFFRLHAEYGAGALDPAGLAACIRGRHGLAQLSAERLGQETRRLLGAGYPMESVAAMADTGKRASQLARQFESVPQMLRNVRYGVGKEPLKAAAVQAAISSGEARLNGTGRLLIRKSGTEPLIRVMAECEDEALLGEVVGEIVAAVSAAV